MLIFVFTLAERILVLNIFPPSVIRCLARNLKKVFEYLPLFGEIVRSWIEYYMIECY